MKKNRSLIIPSLIVFGMYFLIFILCALNFKILPENGPSRVLIIISIILSVIDIVIISLTCWVMFISSNPKNRELIEKKPNPDLDLWFESGSNCMVYLSSLLFIPQVVIGIIKIIVCIIAAVTLKPNLTDIQGIRLTSCIVVYIVALGIIGIFSFYVMFQWNLCICFIDSNEIEDSLKDKENLLQLNITPFFNLTRYMLSTFGSECFTNNGTVFVDIENEIEQIYGNTAQVHSYLMGLDNYIFIIDCDDVFLSENRYGIPQQNKYNSIEELIGTVEDKYIKLSPLSTLTVGVLNVPDETTADIIRKCFRFPCNIIFIESIYNIDPLVFVKDPNENMYYMRIEEAVSGKAQISSAIADGIAVNFKNLWALLEYESGYTVDFGRCNEYFILMIKEMLFESSNIRRVMFGFDCLEFMMRVIAINLWVRNNGIEHHEKYAVPSGFSGIACQIINNISPDVPQYTSISYAYKLPDTAQRCIKEVCMYYGYSTFGDEYDLCGIVTLLKEIRNKTRGHGIINKNNSGIVWNFLVCTLFLISQAMEIENFSFQINGQDVLCGYGDSICNVSPLIWADNCMPCIPVSVTNTSKKSCAVKQYMNFFNGKYIRPEFVT